MPTPNPQDIYDNGQPAATRLDVQGFGALTTAEEVRSLFGLSDAEIPDEMLVQPVYSFEVGSKLSKILGDKVVEWPRISASPDAKDQRLTASVKRWAAYAFADKVCDVLPLVTARTMTDSKASFQRFDTDLQTVILSIRTRFGLAEKDLMDELEALSIPMKRPPIMGSGRPAYDPVVGGAYET